MNFQVDHSLTVFTNEGKLSQCDDALKAALNGSLSVGACSEDGVVLASLKELPQLVDRSKVFKINKIGDSIGMTYSGLQADYRIILDKAMELVEDYKEIYGRYPYVDIFVTNLSRVIQEYTQKGGLRPFGVLLLISGGIPDSKNRSSLIPLLYQMDPSGSFQVIDTGAIGREYSNAAKYIERRLELIDDNIVSCIGAMKDHAGFSIGDNDVDIGVYYPSSNIFKVFSRAEVKDVFESIK
ncbi:Proteasome subunit alpha type-2 [Astathelohania contejeani]|uniref:Proteasome subunit alpha type-2 n=1 Tax=Astathelohania contejeani TaxID=164912 RepID=A0ABQ7HWC8_9MICR|nr:Proteasome subunit alpha type-2 [Thelohania contejeani]